MDGQLAVIVYIALLFSSFLDILFKVFSVSIAYRLQG